jgi:RpiR family carbohydrate utilization transcriptional regulator
MRDVRELISKRFGAMTRAEREVGKFVLESPGEVILLSMQALADRVGVSDNSVLRFCRTCGHSGYVDFKTALLPSVIAQQGSIYRQVKREDSFSKQQQKVMENIVSAVERTYQDVREADITLVAKKLAGSSSVCVVGLAGSAGVAMVFSDSLLSLGKSSVALSDRVEIERYCSCLGEGAVVVGFSASGETPEVLSAIDRASENGAFTVLVSCNTPVKGADRADVFLFARIPSQELAGAFFALPRIAQLSLAELVLSQIPAYSIDKSKPRKRGARKP